MSRMKRFVRRSNLELEMLIPIAFVCSSSFENRNGTDRNDRTKYENVERPSVIQHFSRSNFVTYLSMYVCMYASMYVRTWYACMYIEVVPFSKESNLYKILPVCYVCGYIYVVILAIDILYGYADSNS